MPNKRIDQLNPNLDALTGNELIPIFDTNSSSTEKITINTLASFIDVNNDTFITAVDFNTSNSLLTLYRNDGNNLTTEINTFIKKNILSGETLTISSGHQSIIYGDFVVEGNLNLEEGGELIIIDGDLILSGGTISGGGTTYLVEFFNSDRYTTGTTLNGNVIEFNRTDLTNAYSVDLTPALNSVIFTGNTSANCITDIFVTNVNSCSPIHIQPTNSGDVYISENGGNVGIGTTNPISTLDVNGDVNISNSLSATTFYGDGSNLINVNVTPPYKVYTAILYQVGTSAPTAYVLENTLGGSITWSYVGVGIYYGTLTSAFTANKTVVFLQKKTTLTPIGLPRDVISYRQSDDAVLIVTVDDTDFIDDVLNEHAIEIRVYN